MKVSTTIRCDRCGTEAAIPALARFGDHQDMRAAGWESTWRVGRFHMDLCPGCGKGHEEPAPVTLFGGAA